MKKKNLEFVAVLLGLLIFLGACGGNNSGEAADTSDQEEKYTERELLEKCPPPQPGYVLVGVTYVFDGAAKDIYGKEMPGAGGYSVAQPLSEEEGGGDGITVKLVCVYDAIEDPFWGRTPLSCPPPKEGYYLAGWVLYSNTFGPTMEEGGHSGKTSPSEGGYAHTETGRSTRVDGSPIDYVLVCIYEPYGSVEWIVIDLSCPLDPGYVPSGFTFKIDGNVVVSWGEQEAGPRTRIFADEGTYEADGETHKEEKRCLSTPIDDMVPAQMPDDEGTETSEPPSGECTQYEPGEVACDAPEDDGECVFSPPDDLFQPPDSPECVDPAPDGEPCCDEWEGADCLPLDDFPVFEDGFESGNTSAWCAKVSGEDTDECSDPTDLSMCEAELRVLAVYEGVSCDSEDVAWVLIDDGDGQYFQYGDVGFAQNGDAFYYTGPYEFEYYRSDTLVGATCTDGRLIVEMTIYAYEVHQYFGDGKVTYLIGYDHAKSGSTFMTDELAFDLSGNSSNQ